MNQNIAKNVLNDSTSYFITDRILHFIAYTCNIIIYFVHLFIFPKWERRGPDFGIMILLTQIHFISILLKIL
jgi:hypothetical protein